MNMDIAEKIKILQSIPANDAQQENIVREIICESDLLKQDYTAYMTTHPINCDTELQRLQTADYDLCCALLTMLLREDHFGNGTLEMRLNNGDIKRVVNRIISVLKELDSPRITAFSEKTLTAINGYYVYALIDPRSNDVFYIGKGTGNRIFSHETESRKNSETEKEKILRIQDIEKSGFSVKRIMINWGLSEQEAFAAETSLINLFHFNPGNQLTNIVAGHHTHEGLTVENFELKYGAIPLKPEEIKHNILVIKINKQYRKDMSDYEIYDAVRGMWRVSIKSIKAKNIQYVFAVYNGLIVGVYKPDEWHYAYENIDIPQQDKIDNKTFEKLKNRAYFICKKFDRIDEEGAFYLHKSIDELKLNKSAQNPISYLMSGSK